MPDYRAYKIKNDHVDHAFVAVELKTDGAILGKEGGVFGVIFFIRHGGGR